MLVHHKYNTIASVVTAVITIIGVSAALGYYLSLKPGRNWFDFFNVYFIYFIIIILSILVTEWRLKIHE